MSYIYKSFAFICTSLAVVTKEVLSKADEPFELFEDIIYQKLGENPSFTGYANSKELEKLYQAWSLIKRLIEENNSFDKATYKEVIQNTLYTDAEYEITDCFHYEIISKLKNLIDSEKELFQSFFVMGADRYLNELIRSGVTSSLGIV